LESRRSRPFDHLILVELFWASENARSDNLIPDRPSSRRQVRRRVRRVARYSEPWTMAQLPAGCNPHRGSGDRLYAQLVFCLRNWSDRAVISVCVARTPKTDPRGESFEVPRRRTFRLGGLSDTPQRVPRWGDCHVSSAPLPLPFQRLYEGNLASKAANGRMIGGPAARSRASSRAASAGRTKSSKRARTRSRTVGFGMAIGTRSCSNSVRS
jgi:hypothetical protein